MRSHLSRASVAAVAMTAATYAGAVALSASPADAAACSTADGVTVVVDFHGLGGGLQQVCDVDGGGQYANTLFTDNGFDLTYVQKQPGFVCRIEAKPADDPCVNTPPADAYWGLWWSDGSSGTWSYSSVGAGSLKVPEGGAVAFSWNSGAGQDKPGANPPKHKEPSPSPTPSPSPSSSGNGGGGGSNGGSGSTTAPPPSATPSAAPSASQSATSSASASAKPTKPKAKPEPDETESAIPTVEASATVTTDEVESTASPPAADDGGLPVWLAPVVVVLLFGAAAGVAVVRRRRGPATPPGP